MTVPLPVAVPGSVGAAVVLALLSTVCFAGSAVLQERESRQADSGSPTAGWSVLRRPRWWIAVGMTVAGAGLHITALAWGPLSLIQPLGILTLVLALPLGARMAGRIVTRREWVAAAAAVGGLAAVLSVAPHGAPTPHLPAAVILTTAAVVATGAAGLYALGTRMQGHRIAPVIHAVAAAVLFGAGSGMARVAVTGGPFPLAAAVAVLGSVSGLAVAQRAYRAGGLGAPLATINLADPLTAVIIGVVLLGEPFAATPGRVLLGAAGLLATAAGIGALTRPRPSHVIVAATPAAGKLEVVHVVR
ncbi:MAG: hypothetical protein BGP03_00240 [Pseudonocardia sp. 73-21]|nr:MAG: hypothetical protein BGP03_00240 [Pseudonocardia sp. 73-21]